MTTALTIAQTAIRRDSSGRYCLNDLHKAAGGLPNKNPGEWLKNAQTQEVVSALAAEAEGNSPLAAFRGIGTYVVKELVYAYAMWISPKFHIQVIRAYDALVTGAKAQAEAPQLRAVVVKDHGALTALPEEHAQRLADWLTWKGYGASITAALPEPVKALPAPLWTDKVSSPFAQARVTAGQISPERLRIRRLRRGDSVLLHPPGELKNWAANCTAYAHTELGKGNYSTRRSKDFPGAVLVTRLV